MTLVKVSRESLLKPLQSVAGIIERRQTLPILSNVLLVRSATKLEFVVA
jgi:DNA polymerase III subunit beta